MSWRRERSLFMQRHEPPSRAASWVWASIGIVAVSIIAISVLWVALMAASMVQR